MAELIYTKYSNERSRRFSIRTDIMEEEGKRFVRKKAMYPEGQSHVDNLLVWQEKLKEPYAQIGYVCNECRRDGDGVVLSYVKAQTLEEQLDALLSMGETKQAAKLLETYLKKIERICSKENFVYTREFEEIFGKADFGEMTCAAVTNIDMVCQNLIMEETPVVLDYEWTFAFPIPGKFVLYRVIHYYLDTHPLRVVLNAEEFYESFGISSQLRETVAGMEESFQKYITGEHIPMREMFADMSPGVAVMRPVSREILQVYFSYGQGYCEEDSVKIPYADGKAFCEIELPKGCQDVRMDPGDHPCVVKLGQVAFDGEEVSIDSDKVPGGKVYGEWAYIPGEDPSIWPIPVPVGAEKLVISCEIYPDEAVRLQKSMELEAENRRLKEKLQQQARTIQEMENTKVWKVYRKYRQSVERKK